MAGSIVAAAVIAGAGLYYAQVYAFYEELDPAETSVELTSLVSGSPEEILYENLDAIDSDSSPIRYRACFTTPMSHPLLTETYEMYEEPTPLIAPGWFDCFNAQTIAQDLESGAALAFLGQRDVIYGIDRVVAVHEDGRGFVWQQINRCGEAVFDGEPAPEGCPPPPENMPAPNYSPVAPASPQGT